MDLENELFDGVETATEEQLNTLKAILSSAVETQRMIDFHENALKAAKAELHHLTTKALPDAMAASHTTSYTMMDGTKVEIKDFVNASLPKDEKKREEAINYLEENGAGDLIKTQIEVALGKGEHNIAGDISAYLEELGVSYTADKGVHPQTLASWIRERLKGGQTVDTEKLGAFVGRHAKVTLPKGDVRKVSKPRGVK